MHSLFMQYMIEVEMITNTDRFKDCVGHNYVANQ